MTGIISLSELKIKCFVVSCSSMVAIGIYDWKSRTRYGFVPHTFNGVWLIDCQLNVSGFKAFTRE